ncbi:MAG: peptidoglycan editing factor PgeF [Syntrophobacterales bacterium]|nr:MAG: peptidoglycan editing factor PgeF [Syntrophobacterales bacterium]
MISIAERDEAKTLGEITYFEAPSLKALDLVNHAFCTRIRGVRRGMYSSLNLAGGKGEEQTRIHLNRKLVAKTFRIGPAQLITMDQIHGDRIWIIDKPLPPSVPSLNCRYDALLTDQREIAIGVLTADCVPIMLVDPNHTVIGIIHAGWRGTFLGITRKAIHKMIHHFGIAPEGLLVAIGPSIGECCYEVDEDVMALFRSSGWNWQSFSRPRGGKKWTVNLAQANIEQMKDLGVRDENCCWMRICTACNHDIFFSSRAQGTRTGRQISFIQLRDSIDTA